MNHSINNIKLCKKLMIETQTSSSVDKDLKFRQDMETWKYNNSHAFRNRAVKHNVPYEKFVVKF
jgi:hypothetical protein